MISYLFRFLQIANNFIPGGLEHNTSSSETQSKDIALYVNYYEQEVVKVYNETNLENNKKVD